MDKLTQSQQIRVAALQQAPPLAMLLAQMTGQAPTVQGIFDLADRIGHYITAGVVTSTGS